MEEGLSGRRVFDIVQDHQGFIWIATDHAVERFDGYQFNVMGEFPKYKELLMDSKHRLWILQYEKRNPYRADDDIEVDIFLPKRQTFASFREVFGTSAPFTEKEITDVKILGDDIWLMVNYHRIYLLKDDQFELQLEMPRNYFKDWRVYPVAEDTVWMGKGKDVRLVNAQEGIIIQQSVDPKVEHHVREFDLDEDGQLRVVTNTFHPTFGITPSVYYLDHQQNFQIDSSFIIDLPNGYLNILKSDILNLWKDNQSLEWKMLYHHLVADDEQGNRIFDFKDIPKLSGSEIIQAVESDDQGNLWVGTDDGLFFINLSRIPFKNYLAGKDPAYSCRGIMEIAPNRLLVNTYRGHRVIDLQSDEVTKFWEKGRGYGTDFMQDGDTTYLSKGYFFKLVIPSDAVDTPLITQKIESDLSRWGGASIAFRDQQTKTLWLSFFNEFGYLDPSGQAIPLDRPSHTAVPKYVYHFYENEEGLWMAAKNGLFLFDPLERKVIKRYSLELGNCPAKNFGFIFPESDEIFWLATHGQGLIRWDRTKDTWDTYDKQHGFLNLTLHAIYEDRKQNFWIPTENGLVQFNRESRVAQVFLPRDGIPHIEFNRHAHYQTADGRLIFGGLAGYTVFHPDSLSANQLMEDDLPFQITKVRLFNRQTSNFSNVTVDFFQNRTISLSSTEDAVVIDYALLDYLSGGNITYAYRVLGYDESWNYQKSNSLQLAGLPYGNYTLQLKAQGTGARWSEAVSIPIVMVRPFYLKTWFILAVVLTLGGLVWAWIKWRTRQLEKRALRLEKEVLERTQKIRTQKEELEALNQTKDRLFSIVAHDLRAPAFGLQDTGKKLKYLIESRQEERLLAFGDSVDHSVSKLNRLLDNLLNWSHQNLKTTSLQSQNWSVRSLVQSSIENVKADMNAKQQSIVLDIAVDLMAWTDQQATLTILRNLLNNAVKFTPIGGRIELFTVVTDRYLELSIKDNGMGITADRLTSIFALQKHKSTIGTAGEKGTGLGLSVSKELAVLNGGDLKVQSTPGAGSIFTLLLLHAR